MGDISQPLIVTYLVSGSAVIGQDYLPFPGSVVTNYVTVTNNPGDTNLTYSNQRGGDHQ